MKDPKAFTPGPWTVACGSVYRDNGFAEDESKATPIAHMDRDTDKTFPVERDNNARLIAAAPDLLQACELALEEMMAFRAYWNGPTMNLARSKARAEEVCEAAIAKARRR